MDGQTFRVNEPDVIWQQFDQEVVAIYLPSGTYFSLGGSGADIFRAWSYGPASRATLTTFLAESYRIPAEAVEPDVAAFLTDLERNSLIVKAGIETPSRLPVNQDLSNRKYQAPVLSAFDDLQSLFLLDPVHDVTAAGWPNEAQEDFCDPLSAPSFECQVAGSHVIFERFLDETVVLNAATGAYFSLHGPAEDIFLLLPQTPTLREILKALHSKYSVPEPELEKQVRKYLRSLQTSNLILALPLGGLPGAVRDLSLERPGASLPFSALSFEVFGPPPTVDAGTAGIAAANGPVYYQLRSEGLLIAATADGTVLADRKFGNYYSANEPTARALELLRRPITVQALAQALVASYDVSPRDIAAAVLILAGNLTNLKLIAPTNDVPGPAEAPPPELVPKKPFPGFELALHRDLQDVLVPFNPLENSDIARSPSSAARLMGALADYARRTLGQEQGKCYKIGGATIRLVQPEGCNLDQAWSHLQAPEASDAALTIYAFPKGISDVFFLSAAMYRLSREWQKMCGPRGEVLEWNSPELQVIFHPGPDVLTVLNPAEGVAYYVKHDSSPLPSWEVGSPFRIMLHSWFSSRGLQFLHGAAVASETAGVLLAGKGGAGKSTTALLSARAGMRYAGDDYCLVDCEAGHIFSLYNTAKLKGPADLDRLPEFAGRSQNSDGFERGGSEKAIFFLSDVWPQRVTSDFPLRAILIPHLALAKDSRLEPCTPREALLALLPSTVAQLPAANASDCERLALLAAKLPAYRLHLGSDLDQIPLLVRQAAQ